MLGRIGDMILLTSLIELLKKKYPESQLEVIASNHNFVVLKDNPNISNHLIYNKKFNSTIKLVKYLRLNKFDYYIDPKDHFSKESSILSKVVRAKSKIGFNNKGSNNFNYPIPFYNAEENLHFTQRLMKSLKYLNVELPELTPKPILYENKDSAEFVDRFLKQNNLDHFNKRIIIINISASKPNKMWDIEKWKELISKIEDLGDFHIILTFDPKHLSQAELIKNAKEKIILFKSRNFSDIISLYKFPDYVISTDTSIVHVSAAFNKPIVVLYAGMRSFSTNFRPLSDIHYSCFAPENEDNLENISVNEVFDAFQKIISL